jgi:adenylate cyclase
MDARAVGRELHVRYVAEGEVRRFGERVVVSVQLVDTRNACEAWGQQFELKPVHAATDEDSFSRRLTSELRYALFTTEMRRAGSAAELGTSPMELVVRAHAVSNLAYTPQATRDASKLLDDALQLEPNLVPALNECVWNLWKELELDVHADRDRIVQRMDELSGRAVGIDNGDAYSWLTRGFVLGLQGRWQAALTANDLARRLDPTRKSAILCRAWLMYLRGEPKNALAFLQEAHAIFPDDDVEEVRLACMANLMLGRWDDAIALGEKAAGMSTWYIDQVVLAAAYANNGDRAKAAAAKGELDRLVPGYSIAVWKAKRYSEEPAFLQQSEGHLLAGLRKAGVPEQ